MHTVAREKMEEGRSGRARDERIQREGRRRTNKKGDQRELTISKEDWQIFGGGRVEEVKVERRRG